MEVKSGLLKQPKKRSSCFRFFFFKVMEERILRVLFDYICINFNIYAIRKYKLRFFSSLSWQEERGPDPARRWAGRACSHITATFLVLTGCLHAVCRPGRSAGTTRLQSACLPLHLASPPSRRRPAFVISKQCVSECLRCERSGLDCWDISSVGILRVERCGQCTKCLIAQLFCSLSRSYCLRCY